MQTNDAKASTVKEYLITLLAKLWAEGENFSSYRPFGASDWEIDIFKALTDAGLMKLKQDDEGDMIYNYRKGEKLIAAAIQHMSDSQK